MGNSDGSVVLSFDLNVDDVERQMAKLKKKWLDLEDDISKKIDIKTSLEEELQNAEDKLLEIQKKASEQGIDYQHSTEWQEAVKQADRLNAEIEKYNQQIQVGNFELDATANRYNDLLLAKEELTGAERKTTEDARETEQNLDKSSEAASRLANNMKKSADEAKRLKNETKAVSESYVHLGSAMNRAGNFLEKFTTRIKRLASRVFVFTLITSALQNMRTWLGNIINGNEQASASIAKLKGALLTLVTPIVQYVIPALTFLIDVVSQVVSILSVFINSLFGRSPEEAAKAAEDFYNEQKALDGIASSAKKAQKALAGFDEINRLGGDNASTSFASSSIAPIFNLSTDGIVSDFLIRLKKTLFDWDADDMTAKEVVDKIMTAIFGISGAIIGWSIGGPWGAGLGFILGAAIGFTITDYVMDEDGNIDKEKLAETISKSMPVVGIAVGFSVAGPLGALIGGLLGTAIGEMTINWDLMKDSLKSGWKVVSGLFKGLFYGDWNDFWEGLGENMQYNFLAKGVSGWLWEKLLTWMLGSSEKYDELKDKILNTNDLAELGRAMIAGVFTGVKDWMSGIGQWIQEHIFDPVVKWFKNVFGIHSPASAPEIVGIGSNMIAGVFTGVSDWMSNIGTWIDTNVFQPVVCAFTGVWEGITDAFSETGDFFDGVWGDIKLSFGNVSDWFGDTFADAWDKVKKVFSKGGSAFEGIQGGILDGLKEVINKLIDGINKVVGEAFNGLNASLNKLKDINIYGLRPFDFIKTISVPKIPHLARGAVIPPNREFMAVLGDQKHGTNVEAPLETIQEALVRAISEMGGAGGISGNTDAVDVLRQILHAINGIQIGDDVIGRANARYERKMAVVRGGTI